VCTEDTVPSSATFTSKQRCRNGAQLTLPAGYCGSTRFRRRSSASLARATRARRTERAFEDAGTTDEPTAQLAHCEWPLLRFPTRGGLSCRCFMRKMTFLCRTRRVRLRWRRRIFGCPGRSFRFRLRCFRSRSIATIRDRRLCGGDAGLRWRKPAPQAQENKVSRSAANPLAIQHEAHTDAAKNHQAPRMRVCIS